MLDAAKIEKDFARLLREGWPKPVERSRPTVGGLTALLVLQQIGMAAQLANSSVPETRAFWRAKYPALATPAEAEAKEGRS